MDRRSEPRFQVHSPATVTELSDPEHQVDCILLDISATGMKLVADESLSVDGQFCVEFESHLVLANVRHSQPRGSKFIVGAERVHTLPKLELPLGATRIEKIQALIGDFHLRLHNGGAGIESVLGAKVGRAAAQIEDETSKPSLDEPELGALAPVVHSPETEDVALALPASLWGRAPKPQAEPGVTEPAIDATITKTAMNRDELLLEPAQECASRGETAFDLVRAPYVESNVLPARCNIEERRSEPRIAVDAPVVMVRLAAVTIPPLRGRVVNVSGRGVRVHVDALLNEPPRTRIHIEF